MDYIFTATNLTKTYGKCNALKELNMHVPKGAIYGFVGRNGAGKTTLLRILCGHQSVTDGEFSLKGVLNTDARIINVRRSMGAIIETPAIYPDMSALDNMKQQYRILGISSFDTIPDLLKTVGLNDTGRKHAKNFSLGMRQKLGIAMALAGNPDFMILDEPLNGLDPQGIIELRELILKLSKDKQVTFIISSHILGELSKLATHYGFIDHGKIIKEMTAEELEKSCRRLTCFEVSNMAAFIEVMNNMQKDYEQISENLIKTDVQITITKLAKLLDDSGCEIFNCYRDDENLEEYFIHMVGGLQNA